jgi:hypothetical protein
MAGYHGCVIHHGLGIILSWNHVDFGTISSKVPVTEAGKFLTNMVIYPYVDTYRHSYECIAGFGYGHP